VARVAGVDTDLREEHQADGAERGERGAVGPGCRRSRDDQKVLSPIPPAMTISWPVM
jgi:hypothetical protein